MANKTVLLFLVGALCVANTLALECYTCTGEISYDNDEEVTGAGGDEESCATRTNENTVTGYYRCFTKYTIEDDDTVTIQRGGDMSSDNETDFCEGEGSEKACYCNTDKCNSEAMGALRTHKCYVCSTVDYFDNGCGEEFQPTAKYIETASGCSACGKSVKVNEEDFTVEVTRGCIRSVDFMSKCVEDKFDSICACEEDLCNASQNLRFTLYTFLVSAILSAAKFYL